MVYLYTCDACQRGEHEKCERGFPAPKGTFGGSMCKCHCAGRSEAQIKADEERERKRMLDAMSEEGL